MSLDPRAGLGSDNPRFGYGGYWVLKDTKQLKENYTGILNAIITAMVPSNKYRKICIAGKIISKEVKMLGIHGLILHSGSGNFRSAAIYDIANQVKYGRAGDLAIFAGDAWKAMKELNWES